MELKLRPFKELLAVDDEQLGKAWALGWELFARKAHADAQAVFEGLCALDATQPAFHAAAAVVASARKRDDEAMEHAARAAWLIDEATRVDDAAAAAVRAALAVVHARAGATTTARAHVDAALAGTGLDARWRPALEHGARVLADAERARATRDGDEGAIDDVLGERLAEVATGAASLAEVLGYDDAALFALARRGQELLSSARVDEARAVFEGLVALEPRAPLFWVGLAETAAVAGDEATASRAYDAALVRARGVADGAALVAFVEERRRG